MYEIQTHKEMYEVQTPGVIQNTCKQQVQRLYTNKNTIQSEIQTS